MLQELITKYGDECTVKIPEGGIQGYFSIERMKTDNPLEKIYMVEHRTPAIEHDWGMSDCYSDPEYHVLLDDKKKTAVAIHYLSNFADVLIRKARCPQTKNELDEGLNIQLDRFKYVVDNELCEVIYQSCSGGVT